MNIRCDVKAAVEVAPDRGAAPGRVPSIAGRPKAAARFAP